MEKALGFSSRKEVSVLGVLFSMAMVYLFKKLKMVTKEVMEVNTETHDNQ